MNIITIARWLLMVLFAICLHGQVTVPMSQYNLERTGANLEERILHPSNVNPRQFGRIFTRTVDSTVYALPLIIPNVEIAGARRNVMFIATMGNTVYVFDADDGSRVQPYWSRNLGTPGEGDAWIGPFQWGILGTPYIDVTSQTLYVVARSRNGPDVGLWLHALDLRTGQGKFNSPQRLSFPFAGGPVLTDIGFGIQRAGLLVVDDTLVIAFANIRPEQDPESEEGFLQSFDARDVSKRLAVFRVTPTGLKGGIWQAGRGIAADGSGNIYVATAGGSFDGRVNFGSSVLKLSPKTLSLVDWFAPSNFDFLYHNNIDISANGVTLIPGTSLLFAGGKEGVLYLLSRSSMGRLATPQSAPLQRFPVSEGCGLVDCSQTLGTAFWQRGTEGSLFVWDRQDVLRAYRFVNQRFETTPFAKSAVKPVMTGGPSVSANGADIGSGLVWAVTTNTNANDKFVAGTLRAFQASDLVEIYNSEMNLQRDFLGNFTKFAPPVVANGKVYIVTHSNLVAVYGLFSPPQAPPPPLITIESVVNTADYSPRVAFQSLATISGRGLASGTCTAASVPLPNELCGASVLIRNASGAEALAPLLYVSPTQINFQTPATQWSMGKDPVRKQISTMAVDLCVVPAGACTTFSIREQAPAIFTYHRDGVVDPIITHANGTLVSPLAPATWGETLILYATGYGYQNPGFPRDGSPAPLDRLIEILDRSTVHLETGRNAGVSSGIALPSLFAGLAPGFLGLYQINCTLPAEAIPGEAFLFLKGAQEGQSLTVRLYVQ